ncbi:unnamed protein product [Caretta caretta]
MCSARTSGLRQEQEESSQVKGSSWAGALTSARTVHFADGVESEECVLPGWDPEPRTEEAHGMDLGTELEDSEGLRLIEVNEEDEEQNCLFEIAQTTDVMEWIIKGVQYTCNLESFMDPEPYLD